MLPSNGIVLAPLAGGPGTPELAAAVSNAGGLGFLPGAYSSAAALGDSIVRARSLSSAPLGLNLFVLRAAVVDEVALAEYARQLEPEARRLGVELGRPRFDDDGFAAKLEVAIAAAVDVVSFTFGCPSAVDLARVRSAGAESWLTVTSVEEARAAAAAGADVLVVQGPEAGGHRGTWDDRDNADVSLGELVAAVAAAVDAPLVAAGGLADRAGVLAAIGAGADAVQVGTAFLLCPEAGTSEPHVRSVAAARETDVTRAFTGRRARGVVNRFMREHPHAPSAYPQIHHLTAPLRAAARAAGDADSINLWAGTRVSLARAEPAADVVRRLRP